jgi:L-ascorbate peroxidase
MAGGCSWTTNWLHFDNSYFKRNDAENNQLLWLPTDKALKECPEFRKHFLRYAEDQDAFFADYIIAHRKMSDNGSNFSPKLGLLL